MAVGEDVTQKGQEAGSKVRQTMRRGWVAVELGRAAQTHWASAVNSVCVTCSQDSQTTARVGEHGRLEGLGGPGGPTSKLTVSAAAQLESS